MVPHAVEHRFAHDHPGIADDRERLQGTALEYRKARRAAFGVNQSALRHPVLPVLEVEYERAVPAVADDRAYALEGPERGIKDRERRDAGTGVIVPADANVHDIDI